MLGREDGRDNPREGGCPCCAAKAATFSNMCLHDTKRSSFGTAECGFSPPTFTNLSKEVLTRDRFLRPLGPVTTDISPSVSRKKRRQPG